MNDSAAGPVQRSMRGTRYKRRRNGQPTPLELLLGDPGTVHAAAAAFALAERPEAAAWPIVASVGPDTVTLRWAGGASTIPEPEAPWRVGHDARVWIADRDEIGGPVAGPTSAAVLVIGRFKESLVFVNTSRAPGPITVGGSRGSEPGLLRELVTRQRAMTHQTGLDDAGQRGAWWPVEVEGDVVVLLGLAIARMFTADEVRSACELMERAMVREREDPGQLPAVADDVEPDEQSGLDDLKEEEQAVAQPEPEPEPEPVPASAPEPAALSKPIDAGVLAPAVQPTTPPPTPTPAADGLEDWAAAFAVSSRTSPEPTN